MEGRVEFERFWRDLLFEFVYGLCDIESEIVRRERKRRDVSEENAKLWWLKEWWRKGR